MTDDTDKDRELKKILSGLTAREAKVLKERFGIDATEPKSLEETAQDYEVTVQKIREIEERALKRLNKRDPDPDDAT